MAEANKAFAHYRWWKTAPGCRLPAAGRRL